VLSPPSPRRGGEACDGCRHRGPRSISAGPILMSSAGAAGRASVECGRNRQGPCLLRAPARCPRRGCAGGAGAGDNAERRHGPPRRHRRDQPRSRGRRTLRLPAPAGPDLAESWFLQVKSKVRGIRNTTRPGNAHRADQAIPGGTHPVTRVTAGDRQGSNRRMIATRVMENCANGRGL